MDAVDPIHCSEDLTDKTVHYFLDVGLDFVEDAVERVGGLGWKVAIDTGLFC
jgi:hypothetical protein